MTEAHYDTDVLVIGSGFGGSVAALRFAEGGEEVLVLERGGFVSRAAFEADLDALWRPERNAFGFHDIRKRGKDVIPWLGSAVGGGSHVYAGTLMRRETFEDLPGRITVEEMARHYDMAESMMDATPYPAHPPYSEVRATQFLVRAGARLKAEHPELVHSFGLVNLGISFAPPGGRPGSMFTNKHGAKQRYQDPREQAILGGDIDVKNTLDRNYLFVAQRMGARIRPFHDADRIEPVEGGYRVHCRQYLPEGRTWRGFARRWFPWALAPNWRAVSYTARRVVVSAGAVGSTELLLRSRDVHRCLPGLSPRLGRRYTTNGDWITFLIPSPRIALAWMSFFGTLAALFAGRILWMLLLAALYYGALAWSRRPYDPDVGTTTSDYVRFVGRRGENQGAYIEGGRYPNPGKGLIALLLSLFRVYTPGRYIAISRAARWLRDLVPPFGALARTWPIPLLTMGADDAVGAIELDSGGKALIRFDPRRNRDYYTYVSRLGRKLARAAGAWWLPNLGFLLFRKLEIPHNQGGVPMGDSVETGVVDPCGRVFGYKNFMVLDGSILAVSPRPNPALTILALSERGMEHALRQLRETGHIAAVTCRR